MDRFNAAMEILEYKPSRLFFEKPLVATQGQENVIEQDYYLAKEIIHKTGLIQCETAMVFNYRFFGHVKKAKNIINERGFGKLLNISAFTHYACWSHVIDLIHYFAGPLYKISAFQGNSIHSTEMGGGMSAQDITACFTSLGDATGTLIGTTSLPWVFPLFEISMNFECGRICLQDLDGDLEILSPAMKEIETHRITNDLSRWDHYNSSFIKSVKAYLESIRNRLPVPVPGISGLMEMQVEAAIKRSISNNVPVILGDVFPI
jgi:predicted dehydrogenase